MTQRKRPPSKVELGYRTFRLNLVDDVTTPGPDGSKDVSVFGSCNLLDGIVEISKDQSSHEMVNTVLHEMLHAGFRLSGMQEDKAFAELEERVVITVANSITELMRRNPDLFKWMTGTLSRDDVPVRERNDDQGRD